MSQFQVDGYIRVPKGTMVYATDDGVAALSTRARVVKITNILDVDVKSENFYLLLPDDLRLRYFEANGSKCPVDPEILDFTDRLTKGDYRAVAWASKWALIADVQLAEPPAGGKAAKKTDKPARQPLTKQQQMVAGSEWRFTEDAELRYNVRNPAYAAAREDLANNLRHLPSHERMQAVSAQLNELGVKDHLDASWGVVKAGETFTIRGKLTSGFAGGQDVPMLFRSEKFTLPYSSLEPFIERVVER